MPEISIDNWMKNFIKSIFEHFLAFNVIINKFFAFYLDLINQLTEKTNV
jgi:hypothetical protein